MSKKKVLDSEYDKIVDMYNRKMTQQEIAKIYNCSVSSISAILKRKNVKTRLGGSNNTGEDILKWAEMYHGGSSLKDIADQYKTTYATVSKLLRKNGIVVDRYTYHFNEHYFDIVDSQDKAYILGMLWADGYNCTEKGSVVLQLQEQDKELLEQINCITNNERPLRKTCLSNKNKNWHDQYMLTWQSKHLSALLCAYGMPQKKSLILEFPKWLSPDLYRHFLRGYLDGDGCISLSKEGKFASVSMIGTSMFLSAVKDIIKKEIGVDVVVKRDLRARDPICTLRCGRKNDVKKILEWIYCDASLFLDRKHKKNQQFLEANKNINNSYLN